jgi:hypothetical protein
MIVKSRNLSTLFYFLLVLSVTACVPEPVSIDEVAQIVSEKCVRCHSEKFITLPEIAYKQYRGGCGGCHVPFPLDHHQKDCTDCHTSPEETHFTLRDEVLQTQLRVDAVESCISCHTGDFHKLGKGFPPLTNEEEIITYAKQGTLRQWIQPGGFMAKYLTDNEVSVVTSWIDTIAFQRKLDYDPYLDAVKIDTDFDIFGTEDNPVWDSATEHRVQLGITPVLALSSVPPHPQTDEVTLKALYSADYFYLKAEYRDSTLSMTGANSWLYETSTNTWKHPPTVSVYEDTFPDARVYDKQSYDKIGFIWNISIPEYRTTFGCALKCHGNVPGASCFTDKEGTTADLWVARTAGGLGSVFLEQDGIPIVVTSDGSYQATAGTFTMGGYLDDRSLIWYMDQEDGYNTIDAGRRADDGVSSYRYNSTNDKKAPLYMEISPENYLDAMVLTEEEITAGEAINTDPNNPEYAGQSSVESAWLDYEAVEALIPEKIVSAPSASRGDILHAATWKDGTWIHVFKRKLSTGNDDDVAFSTQNEYEFSVTVFDNCGWGEIPPAHNTYGSGQYQILRFR